MEGWAFLLILLAVGLVLSGPIALVISIVVLNKVREIADRVERRGVPPDRAPEMKIASAPERKAPAAVEKVREKPYIPILEMPPSAAAKSSSFKGIVAPEKGGTLEQKIGTWWILIAGVITSIVGVGFFLKYAYDNGLIGPLGRVVIAAVAGLIALAVGEATRRRGYGIVAKGVTALGFATLYAAVFSAYRFYGLIGSLPAFALAILVTAAAMLYAVALDEIVIAFLSLLGGFLTPVIVSTGENLPMPLFGYVLVLGIGAMLCSYYRRWRAVNVLSFAGTFLLYTGWFEKFYRHTMAGQGTPEQISIALGWLGVFFAVYLVLPVLYGLVRKVKAKTEDISLVLANAAVTFYYLWTILFAKFRTELAFCAVGLCVAHLILLAVANKRYRDDVNLRLSLLVIGLFFLTIAVPLYLKMYAVAIGWAAEGVVLTIIGLRYRNIWTQAAGAIAFILSLGQLLLHLPMHKAAFQVVLNPPFGTWCFVAAALLVCHVIYRRNRELAYDPQGVISQFCYAAMSLLLLAAVMMEWHWHCKYNEATAYAFPQELFTKGMIPLFAVFTLLLVVRPICPKGTLLRGVATCLGLAGAVFTMVTFAEIYGSSFAIFANVEFAIALLFVAVLFASAILIRQRASEDENAIVFAVIFALAGVFVLWVLLSEEIYLYWWCRNRYAQQTPNWQFLANMYMSIAWAVYGAALMVVGFWRNIKMLRYAALGLFAVLLVKVFVLDMSTVKSVYRIAAFLATGITLVVVSYLYQYLKKKGFFDTLSALQNSGEQSGDAK
jgi:uncharacterized membrane protein